MPVILTGSPGRVVALQEPGVPASARAVRFDSFGGFSDFRSIITRVFISKNGNFQFMHTLGGDIMLYVFGDRVGQLGISGFAFQQACIDGGAGPLGIERVHKFYEQNRIAARARPLLVTIGAFTTFVCYLAKFSSDVADPQTQLHQFDMSLVLIPEPA